MKTDASIIRKFKKFKVLVIGELMVDVYLQGDCHRISPEAAAPVVDLQNRRVCAGGAANVAANLRQLGAEVLFCSVSGEDEGAQLARCLLEDLDIPAEGVIADPQRTTLVKTRVEAQDQTLLRLDQGSVEPLSSRSERRLIEQISSAYAHCDALLISDYQKGIFTPGLIRTLQRLAQQQRKFIAVDSKNLGLFSSLSPDLVKPNYAEAAALLGVRRKTGERVDQIRRLAQQLFEKTGAAFSAVSLDKEGVSFYKKQSFLFHLPAGRVERPYVSGAGDTFISACLLALLSGATHQQAVGLAINASTLAIQKKYTAVCTQAELLAREQSERSVPARSVTALCKRYRAQGKRIVFTNGCFDVLHSGHVRYLKAAKKKGDILIVGINNDSSVKRLKGQSRPVNALAHRMEVLAELSCVDHVIPFGKPLEDNPIALIKKIKPNVFVKGADYQFSYIPELETLKALKTEIVFLPLVKNQSTTKMIARIRSLPTAEKIFLSS